MANPLENQEIAAGNNKVRRPFPEGFAARGLGGFDTNTRARARASDM